MSYNQSLFIDWKEIKDKYPLSYEKAFKWRHDVRFPGKERQLFDFFDEKTEIDITIQVHYYGFPNRGYMWIIFKGLDGVRESPNYDTRKEAEKSAFMKAFQLLEESLLETLEDK